MSEHQRELWQLLPKEYGYVILSIVGIFFVNIFQIILVPFLFGFGISPTLVDS